MPTTDQRAIEIRHKAKEYGLRIHAHGSIVSVSGRFEPNSKSEYVQMEINANEILAMFRQVSSGSIWGSTSDSVGGAIALEKGTFILNKSGCEKALTRRFYSGLQ